MKNRFYLQPLDEISVTSANADHALIALSWHKTAETLDLWRIWSEDCDWSEAGGLCHYQAAPACANVDEVLHHRQGGHLALARTELVINVDGHQGLTAGDQLAAVQLVEDGLGLHLPLVDNTAWVEIGEDVLVVLSGDHLHHLMGLQEGVGHNVLVGDNTVLQTEDGHLTLGLATPDLHLVIRKLETCHTVDTVKGCSQLW